MPNPMLPRFLATDLDPASNTASLSAEEAHHLTHVLRLRFGDEIAVFDGNGREYRARIERVSRDGAHVHLLEEISPAPEPAVRLTLAQAVLKGDKMDEVVRDAVMLGGAAIQPIVTRRTETTVATLIRSSRVERWRRVALASVKQSRRAVLPEVRTPLTFENFLEEPAASLRLMLVEPSACGGSPISQLHHQPIPPDASVLVGPEGGWTEDECTAATAHGVRLVTLGHRTLRADAVPIAAISVLQFLWKDL